MARLTYENAVRAYNGRKVRTKADFNYVMSLRAKYGIAAPYKHERTPPPEYDRPYTDGELTIKRVEITGETTTETMRPLCLSNYNNPLGCAVGRRGLGAWCTIYIVSDGYLKKHSAVMKVLGVTYEASFATRLPTATAGPPIIHTPRSRSRPGRCAPIRPKIMMPS